MKTITNIIIMLIMMLTSFACSSDDPIPEPEPTPPNPEAKYLSILPTISALKETKAGIIKQFADDDKIGIFATEGQLGNNFNDDPTSANMPATYFKNAWSVGTKLEINSEGTAFAYYPYNKTVTSGKNIPIETVSQTDYLYSDKANFSKTDPEAKLVMKHALSLVSIRVRKNDYQLAGHLEKIEISGLLSTGTLDISSGAITKTGVSSDVSREVNIVLDDNQLVKTETIVLPVNIAESPVKIKVTVDGEELIYDVPTEHEWEAGFEYIYTLNLSKMPEEIPEVEFEREYWEKFGKNDNIKIGNNAYPNLTISMGNTYHGRTLVKGEAYIFVPCLTNRNKTDFVGKMKLTLWSGSKMVEQFPAYNIIATKNYFTTYNIPSFVNCDPGTYKLVPLFQNEGSTEWFVPPYGGGVEDDDWMFTVQNNNKIPALKDLKPEGHRFGDGTTSDVNLNENFNLEYTLTNRAGVPISGEIKAVFERTFTNEFRLTWENDGDTYEDEIGKTTIDIDGTDIHKGLITCCITKKRNTWANSGPSIHLYFKSEGTNKWVLLRSDADQELQRWKDITGPDNMFVYGGRNYWHVIHPEDVP